MVWGPQKRNWREKKKRKEETERDGGCMQRKQRNEEKAKKKHEESKKKKRKEIRNVDVIIAHQVVDPWSERSCDQIFHHLDPCWMKEEDSLVLDGKR